MILARMKSNWTCWIFFMTHTFYVNKDRKVCTGPQHLMSDETTLVFALRWKTETGLFRFLFKFRLKTRPWAPCNALRCKKWIICGFLTSLVHSYERIEVLSYCTYQRWEEMSSILPKTHSLYVTWRRKFQFNYFLSFF